MARWSTVLSGVFLALTMILSLGKLLMLVTGNANNGDLTEADQWLAEIGLKQYRPLFKKKGQNSLSYFSNFIILLFLYYALHNYQISIHIKIHK